MPAQKILHAGQVLGAVGADTTPFESGSGSRSRANRLIMAIEATRRHDFTPLLERFCTMQRQRAAAGTRLHVATQIVDARVDTWNLASTSQSHE